MEDFNEATRVQMPAMVHLTRIGYSYFGKISEDMAGSVYDKDTNILLAVFEKQFKKLNPDKKECFLETFKNIKKVLDDDDLGKGFYNLLKSTSPTRLIDFEVPTNNTFHFTAEFTCKNGQDEFRPDITLFINGLPLCFVEVKKPNNQWGIVAECSRMNEKRFPNPKFRRFINITQLMIFSNNMEYDTIGGVAPIQGAFYCTGARSHSPFNCFREENAPIYYKEFPYKEKDSKIEKQILTDYNCQVILHALEYQTNLNYDTPTNRILTSMCSPERLLYILKYAIAYVKKEKEVDGKIESVDQKHIMRYQQLFASMSIREKIEKDINSGVVWHTQGSGKTALSYHLVHVLGDYFAKQNKVTKFYFIVDRLDLLEQATEEFEARGLSVSTANTREELMQQFRNNQAQEGLSGEREIIVVNIQRFAEDKEKIELNNYATNLQRVFILDEAHRGYKPGGCFLANLFDADKNSIKIALTGTPLLKEERASYKVFGKYLHTYYYDKSIADGYTLKIIREDIETSYREKLTEIYNKLETLVEKKDVKKSDIIEHDSYIRELADYIIKDLKEFRQIQGDETLGGMVICQTSEQARKLFDIFQEKNKAPQSVRVITEEGNIVVGEVVGEYHSKNGPLKAGLILHDSQDKETRKQIIKDFKKNMTIDILIVFNMLLTGFDAPRLKRLYFGRKLKDHNLLQAITRVNRPYKSMRYGYVIDFADIKRDFDETNQAYLEELNRFNEIEQTQEATNINTFSQVIEDKEEIVSQMKQIRQILFNYTYDNIEEFSSEISTQEDKLTLLELKHALTSAKDMANLVRTFGDEDLKEKFAKLEIKKLPLLLSEIQHRINIINQKELFSTSQETTIAINEAMKDIEFKFSKVSSEEMKIISGNKEELKDKWQGVINGFTQNIDHEDPEYISLREAFMLRFKEYGFSLHSIDEFYQRTKYLDEVMERLKDLQKRNNVLLRKYNGDMKFTRLHKRIREENERRQKENKKVILSCYDDEIMLILNGFKDKIDLMIYDNNNVLNNEAYFNDSIFSIINDYMYDNYKDIDLEVEDYDFIQTRISRQYMSQYNTNYTEA